MTADFTFCHPDVEHARDVAEQCMATYLQSLLEHYELMGDHLDNMEGYQGYGKQAAKLREIGFDKYVNGFLAANAYGTPDQMLEKYRERFEVIGPFEEARASVMAVLRTKMRKPVCVYTQKQCFRSLNRGADLTRLKNYQVSM